MCSGLRRALMRVSILAMLSAPLLAHAPSSDDVQSTSARMVVARSSIPAGETERPGLPDELAMVLAGTALIGAAAAVRRA
jgi:hypothetical protein